MNAEHISQGKSFYVLEMIAEPGGMAEHLRMLSASTMKIRRMLTARLKTDLGFYALLCYGQKIRVDRYENGEKMASIDMRPFLHVTIPGKLNASFTEEGEAVIRQAAGYPMTPEEVSGLLFDYRAYDEEAETLHIGDWEKRVGRLDGEPLGEGEEAEIKGSIQMADRIYERESEQEYSLAQFMEIAGATSESE